MIYIISNIFFGNPKTSKHQIDYFDNHLLPFFKKNPPEKTIIYGDLFYNTNIVSFKLLSKVKDLLIKISEITKIEILDNDYCKPIFQNIPNINIIDSDGYEQPNITIPRPNLFQMNKDDKTTPGLLIVKGDKNKLIENTITPRYIEIPINSIEELESLEKTKDYIDLIINSELLEKTEYKNKIDIFLNKNNFNNVFYTDKKEKEIVIVKDNHIRNILFDNIDQNLKTTLQEIFYLYDEKHT
jgi:hypothetical protein